MRQNQKIYLDGDWEQKYADNFENIKRDWEKKKSSWGGTNHEEVGVFFKTADSHKFPNIFY